ncbi:MAG: DUF4465 domain-containing protein [Saprospiraceae bacterium]
MQIKFTLFFSLLLTLHLTAQDVADLESFNVPQDSFLNNAGADGRFVDGGLVLPNTFTLGTNGFADSFTGWAISTSADNQTPGFMNQYSAITGVAASGENYAVGYVVDENFANFSKIKFSPEVTGQVVNGLMITNTTYAYLSMLEGDGFTKKFGGETGDDPDYFLLTLRGYRDGVLTTDSVDFYLADYRSDDNSMDYIVNEWTMVDLTSLGAVDSLQFALSSTDNGQFGMNTPAYIAIDDVMATGIGLVSSTFDPAIQYDLSVFPNPTTEILNINWNNADEAIVQVFDFQGRLVQILDLQRGANPLDVTALANGVYALKIQTATGFGNAVFYKK